MTVSIGKNIIYKILISAFMFICIFFPGDPYHLKIPFFIMSCLFGYNAFLHDIFTHKNSYLYIMGICFSLAIMISSIMTGGNIYESVAGAYPATLILLVPVIEYYEIPYKKYMITLLTMLAVLTCTIVFFDIIGFIDLNSGVLREFIYNFDMGLMGKSTAFAAYYKLFFKASPLLLFLIPYAFESKKFWLVVITVLALFFSGTRANIFVATCLCFFGCINIWDGNKSKFKRNLIIAIFSIMILLATLPFLMYQYQTLMGTTGSIASDSIRMGQLHSFLTHFSELDNLLLGDGFGTLFYDGGRNKMTFSSEISYFDLLRKIGLMWFIPFMVFVLKPFKRNLSLHVKLTYLGYLLVATTNPLLFSSTAYILYIYLYSGSADKNRTISSYAFSNLVRT